MSLNTSNCLLNWTIKDINNRTQPVNCTGAQSFSGMVSVSASHNIKNNVVVLHVINNCTYHDQSKAGFLHIIRAKTGLCFRQTLQSHMKSKIFSAYQTANNGYSNTKPIYVSEHMN